MKSGLSILGLALLLVASPLFAQEILFDQMVEAGGLKCYPVYGDDTSWYYLPDQPHVTDGSTGRPEFSFLMYSSPEQRGEEGITEAPGGGIAHFLVAYDVSQDMVRRAQSELARTKPGAQLKGPVSYTDGTFNLVTSVTDPEAGLSRRLVGVGNAPVMSGHKAAVSMHLTPTGAMLLWESFQQRTPDISVNFEMTVSGYRNPVEAEMTFNYERIHETMELEAGIESTYLDADVDVMLGKMMDNGSIAIELKGAPPEQWNEVQKLGIELAKHHLFENLGAAPLSQVRELTRDRSRSSLGFASGDSDRLAALGDPLVETIEMVTLAPPDYDEAVRLAREARRFYDEGRYREALSRLEDAYEEEQAPGLLWTMARCHLLLGEREQGLDRLDDFLYEADISSAAITEARQAIEESADSMWTSSPSPSDRERRSDLILELRDAVGVSWSDDGLTEPSETSSIDSDEDSTASSVASEGAEDGDRAGGGDAGSVFREGLDDDEDDRIPLRDVEFEDSDDPELRRIGPSDRERRAQGGDDDEDPIRLTVAFRFRRIERSGSFKLSMRQWNRVELPVRFAANIGDLSRYMDDSRMFRRVSLNDPMFKQREIPVTVDVASEEAFAAMLNAVTVTLRKRHESGRETVDEVTIQRSDFSSGEVETLVYGWDGDDNRTRWLDYDQRVRWSYLGGPVIETDWERTSAGALVLSPPLRPREVMLEADPVVLREQGVRDVVVEVRYAAVDTERVATATLRPADEVGSKALVLYQDPQSPGYSYSFDWRLYGGRRVAAGPFDDRADYIYVDEIPQ